VNDVEAHTLSVCFRCKPVDWRGPDDARPGAHLADAIEVEAARRGLGLEAFRNVRCMSQCKRPCVVAFSHPEKFTYLFGDLGPDSDAAAVLDAFELYASRDDGFMERFERPEALRGGILGRVPPLSPHARQVKRRPSLQPQD
jgi:predicted metal-binding protein